MKKISLGVIVLALACLLVTGCGSKKHEAVTMYEFYGSTCPHCMELNEWVENDLMKDSKYNKKVIIEKLEVWGSQDNAKLMQDVGAELGVEARGVPFIVIGNQSTSGFSSVTTPGEIKKMIDKAYNDSKYKDIVAEVKNK